MLFVKGVIEKRIKQSVTNKIFKVTYTVAYNDEVCNVFQLTADLDRCLPVSKDKIDIPVRIKVFKNNPEIHYEGAIDTDQHSETF